MTFLSVNVNKFALIRNARDADLPNLYNISKKCIQYGADGITVHLDLMKGMQNFQI